MAAVLCVTRRENMQKNSKIVSMVSCTNLYICGKNDSVGKMSTLCIELCIEHTSECIEERNEWIQHIEKCIE